MEDGNLLTRNEYIEGAASASRRTRFVILVMVVASGLLFISSWNSRKSGWLNSRIESAQQVVAWKAWKSRCPVDLAKHHIDPDRFKQVREFARLRWIEDPRDAEDLLKNLRALQVDRLWTVTVPIFGVVFDVNDLGFVGGFGILVLTMWLRFSLFRELESIRATFTHARRAGRRQFAENDDGYLSWVRETYELLAMRQVLTVPPLRGPDANAFWTSLPKLLLALPAASLSYVVLYDLLTLGFGTSVSILTTLATQVVSVAFLGASWALSMSCMHLHSSIQQLWTLLAFEIGYQDRPIEEV